MPDDDKPMNKFVHLPMPPCKREPLAQRLLYCTILLRTWGVMTPAEASAVRKRIAKEMSK